MATLPTLDELSSRIILALDHPTWGEAFDDALAFKKLGGLWVKVNPIHITDQSSQIVSDLSNRGFKVFLDNKFFNTEVVLGRTAQAASANNPAMINCAAASGKGAMHQFSDACSAARQDCLSIAVTVLTTIGDEECLETYGRTTEDQVMVFARQAARSGMSGVVCSGHELPTIRRDVFTKKLITVVPGIRNAGDSADDQVRIMTPFKAFDAGADYLVMGSSLRKGDLAGNWAKTRRLYAQEWEQSVPV